MRLVIFLLAVGCSSYKNDIEAMCAAPNHIDLPPSDTVADKNQKLGKYLEHHMRTAEGIHFAGAMGAPMGDAVRGKLLRSEAKKVGIADCKLADAFDDGSWSHR